MTQITTYESLLQVIKENLSGDNNLSIRGLAKICGIAPSSISRSLGEDRQNSSKLAKILTQHGFNLNELVKNGFDSKATWIIIRYFANDSKVKSPQAKQLVETFGQLGIELTFRKLNEQPVVETQPVVEPQPVTLDSLNSTIVNLLNLMNSQLPASSKQCLHDAIINKVITAESQKQLPEANKERWLGAAQRATELGYPQAREAGIRSRLGKFVKARAADSIVNKEERLVNGSLRAVNVYLQCTTLDNLIQDFFNQ